MNTTVISYTETPAADRIADANIQNQDSLLDRIVKGLVSYANSTRRENTGYRKPRNFVEENLLDPVMGREISRCLRR